MTLRHWEPAREMEAMERAMDRLWDSFWRPLRWPLRHDDVFEGRYVPLDVYEKDNALIVRADVPGMKPEDVHVEVADNALTIRGELKEMYENKGNGYLLHERRYGSFARSITIPADVDTDKVEATFEDGVLTVSIPKTESAKPKAVKVKAKKSSTNSA